MKKCSGKMPVLPFLPLVTKDLRFMADGNPKNIGDLINFDRFVGYADCV